MDFTNDEKRRINDIYGNDFKGELTSDDVALIARWEKWKIEQDEEYKRKTDEQRKLIDAKISLAREIADMAKENLKVSANRSKERWERLRYGKEE